MKPKYLAVACRVLLLVSLSLAGACAATGTSTPTGKTADLPKTQTGSPSESSSYERDLSNSGDYLYGILVNKAITKSNAWKTPQDLPATIDGQPTFVKVPPDQTYDQDLYQNYELIKVYSDGVYPSYVPYSADQPQDSIFYDDTFEEIRKMLDGKGDVIHQTSFDKPKFLDISKAAVHWVEEHTPLAATLAVKSHVDEEYTEATLQVDHKPGLKLSKILFTINDSAMYATPVSDEFVHATCSKLTFDLGIPSGRNRIGAKVFAENGEQADATTAVESSYSSPPTLHLVAIGINDFPNLPAHARLLNAINDANLVKDTFQKRGTPLFHGQLRVNPYTLNYSQTTKANIQRLIADIRKEVKPNDYFILYVASHGLIHGDAYYFAPSDFDISLNEDEITREMHQDIVNGFGEDQISEYLINIPTIFRMAILDTCHSGKEVETIKTKLGNLSLGRKEGISVLTAAKSDQLATDDYNGHGLFTYVLGEGLNGKADYNHDNIVDTIEIAQYVETNVARTAKSSSGIAQEAVVLPDPAQTFNRRFELTQLEPAPRVTFQPNVFTPRESELYIYAIHDQDPAMMNGIIRNNDRHNHGQTPATHLDNLEADEITKVLLKKSSIDFTLHFQTDSSELAPREIRKLHTIAAALNNPALNNKGIFIEGHADSVGDDSYNLRLSQLRAEEVASILSSTLGVASARLDALGFGELYPVADNNTPEGREKNRRVSIFVYED